MAPRLSVLWFVTLAASACGRIDFDGRDPGFGDGDASGGRDGALPDGALSDGAPTDRTLWDAEAMDGSAPDDSGVLTSDGALPDGSGTDGATLDGGGMGGSDGGPVGRPTAIIGSVPLLACGESSIALDGTASRRRTGGAALTTFHWEIREPAGGVVAIIDGPRGAAVATSTFVRGGTHEAPSVRLTVYDGPTAVRVRLTDATGANQVYQSNVPLRGGTRYVLGFSARASATRNFHVAVINHLSPFESLGLGETVVLGGDWVRYGPFSFGTPSSVPANIRLRFMMTGVGDYWLDDVVLVPDTGEIGAGVNVVNNPSFIAPDTVWGHNFVGAGTFGIRNIDWGPIGAFTVTLVVTDGDGITSVPAVVIVVHSLCP